MLKRNVSPSKPQMANTVSRYNAGHLVEGALAHRLFYKNDDMLSPLLKYVDLLAAKFGDQDAQIPGYPGHPEIELALLRLYKVTGDEKHLKLAQFFIEERGNPSGGKTKRHYYDIEAEARGEKEHERPAYFPASRSYSYVLLQLYVLFMGECC